MPRKKLPGTAVDKRNGQRINVQDACLVQKFDPPEGITDTAIAAWDAYWQDAPSKLMTHSSKVLLIRWVESISRYERFIAQADSNPLVPCRDGDKINPLYRVAAEAIKIAQICERQLGIGTLNATNLGIAAIAEQQRIGDLNAAYMGVNSESGTARTQPGTVIPGDVEPDPRLLPD